MKSIFTRVLALALALVMLLGITACGGSGNGKNNTKVEPLPGEEPVDLGGYEFTVADGNSGRWNKEQSGTPYLDAWIQIMDEVESLYNCTITPTYSSDLFTVVQPEVAAGEKYADLIITSQWEAGQFLGAGLYADLNELDVNWDNEWWNQDIRKIATYGGKTYVGGGSFIFDTSASWLLYYNEAIWNELNLEDPYKMIDEHRWTYDVFRDYCAKACQDQDGTGVMDSAEDRWGLVAPDADFTRAWFFSLGGQYFKTDEDGKVKLACNNTKTYDLIDKMVTMVKKDRSICNIGMSGGAQSGQNAIADFVSGNALFMAYFPGLTQLKDMEDDWGVMPLPLLNAEQPDYITGVDHNSSVFGITNTNTDLDKVSVVLEALGRHAMILENIFWPDYKETYWRHEEKDSAVVSKYVVNHGKHDMALIMQRCNDAFNLPMERIYRTVYGNSTDFSSWIDAVEDSIAEIMEDYFTGLENPDAGDTAPEETPAES